MVLAGNEHLGLQHSFEPLSSVASLVADPDQMLEVAGKLTLVPGDQDRFDA